MAKKKSLLDSIESLEPKWLRKIHFPNWMVLVLALVFLFRIRASLSLIITATK